MNNLLQSQQREISQFKQLSDWLSANQDSDQTVRALCQSAEEGESVSHIETAFDLDAFLMRLRQRYNPYPNMSRHRVLYLFSPLSARLSNKKWGERGLCLQVFKGYVRPDHSYFCKNQLNIAQQLDASTKKKPPTFITELDLLIFQRLQRHASFDQENNDVYLSEKSVSTLFLSLIDTGRAFWQSCDQGPLSQCSRLIASDTASDITSDTAEQNKQSTASISSHGHDDQLSDNTQIITDVVTLDIEHNQVLKDIDLEHLALWLEALWLETIWSNEGRVVEQQEPQSMRLNMTIDSFEGDSLQLAEQSFDFIRISVDIAGVSYDLSSLLAWYQSLTEQKAGPIQLKAIAYLKRLFVLVQSLEPVVAHYQVGAHSRIKPCDLVLAKPLDFDWLQACIQAGFNLQFAPEFRLSQTKGLDWYVKFGESTEQKNGQESYSVELGLAKTASNHQTAQGIDLLPYLKQPITQLNQLWADSTVIEVEVTSGETIRIPAAQVELIRHLLADWAESKTTSQSMSFYQCMRLRQLADQLQATTSAPKSIKQRLESWYTLGLNTATAAPHALLIDKEMTAAQKYCGQKPPAEQVQLRDYQVEGVNWMDQLNALGLGGILADDMGLGKTLQILSYIVHTKYPHLEADSAKVESVDINQASNAEIKQEQSFNHQRLIDRPCLIVVPTSLLNNWLNEAKRFAPQLKVCIYHGAHRIKLLQDICSESSCFDLVVTTYSTLHRDIEHLRIPWWLVVFDEAQTLKNPKSKVRRCAQSLSSQQTFCLSGTPMENHLGELWSLTDLVAPGFLGSYAQFQRLYQKPIENEPQSELANNRLTSLIARIGPLMLRRTKSQVAQELPPKTQIDVSLALTSSQAQHYESVRLAAIKSVRAAVARDDQGTQILVSNAILKLRQICCHHTDDASTALDSCKIAWLNDHLPEMIETGRRVLIFSTFTKMLDTVSVALDALGIEYAMLTGKSRDRAQIIDSFQAGKKPVFLISLKAGGVGLNLTQADTVIHTDPWWNPAAEQQATDRAHRIGQDKPVFVYRLSAENTIETHIHKLQNKKRLLSNQVLGAETLADNQIRFQQWIKLLEQPL